MQYCPRVDPEPGVEEGTRKDIIESKDKIGKGTIDKIKLCLQCSMG